MKQKYINKTIEKQRKMYYNFNQMQGSRGVNTYFFQESSRLLKVNKKEVLKVATEHD